MHRSEWVYLVYLRVRGETWRSNVSHLQLSRAHSVFTACLWRGMKKKSHRVLCDPERGGRSPHVSSRDQRCGRIGISWGTGQRVGRSGRDEWLWDVKPQGQKVGITDAGGVDGERQHPEGETRKVQSLTSLGPPERNHIIRQRAAGW